LTRSIQAWSQVALAAAPFFRQNDARADISGNKSGPTAFFAQGVGLPGPKVTTSAREKVRRGALGRSANSSILERTMPTPVLAPEKVSPTPASPPAKVKGSRSLKLAKRWLKRIVVIGAAAYFIPPLAVVYIVCGLVDFLRNKPRSWSTLDRYFTGNGLQAWLLSPLNLLMDLLTLPYWNKGIYKLTDLPQGHQDEIKAMIAAAHESDLVGKLQEKMGDKPRGMIFFKWYGKNVDASVDVPEFHRNFKYLRTIGVSIFNKKQSTGKHFGSFRVTLRVLYNVNDLTSDKAFIQVGDHVNLWRDQKLFIFDDTLQHKSCNESDEVRYCMFVDILRPSLLPGLMSGILTCVRTLVGGSFRPAFAKNWVMIK
jgi:hypothetical protein